MYLVDAAGVVHPGVPLKTCMSVFHFLKIYINKWIWPEKHRSIYQSLT